uniref:Uncharacterized protein n=1 Tax=Corethron hystrix TaxID=216773 RepID=A0A7S1FSH5_9STRA|mmetsp:Transcript_28149/g.64408  ORF Transcript_28149/g.64408 Transcript_28149/m.64408 type:complete len:482 (+) Transcript_28149:127-1572(+)
MAGIRNNPARKLNTEFIPSQPKRKLKKEALLAAVAAPSQNNNVKIKKVAPASFGRIGRPTSPNRPLSPPLNRARSPFKLPISRPTSPDSSLAPLTARGRTTSLLGQKSKSIQANTNTSISFKALSGGSRTGAKSPTRTFGQNFGSSLKNNRMKSTMKVQNNTSNVTTKSTPGPEPASGPPAQMETSVLPLQDAATKKRNGKFHIFGGTPSRQSSMPSNHGTSASSTSFERMLADKAIKKSHSDIMATGNTMSSINIEDVPLYDIQNRSERSSSFDPQIHMKSKSTVSDAGNGSDYISLQTDNGSSYSLAKDGKQKPSIGRIVFTSTDEWEPAFEDISARGGSGKAALSAAMVMPKENESDQPEMDDSMLLGDREDDKLLALLEKTTPKKSRQNNHQSSRRSDSVNHCSSEETHQSRQSSYKDSRQSSYEDSRYETSLVKKTRESHQRQPSKRDKYIPHSMRERNIYENEDRISKVYSLLFD